VDNDRYRWGERMFDGAGEGKMIEVGYMFPRSGSDTPVRKVSFVAKVTDRVCGVGYYSLRNELPPGPQCPAGGTSISIHVAAAQHLANNRTVEHG
jgi:hypothetical protein